MACPVEAWLRTFARPGRGARCAPWLPLLLLVTLAQASLAEDAPALVAPAAIPMRPGLVVATAVVGDSRLGDYEFTQVLALLDDESLWIRSLAYVKGYSGQETQLDITRQVLLADIATARRQILGFATEDPQVIPGSTALGPSLAMLRELVATGETSGMIRNYADRRDNYGPLRRVEPSDLLFPVLLNGVPVQLPAIHVVGQIGVPGSLRYWDFLLLDHPVQPLTLKVSYGPDKGAPDDPAEWTRQVVRIDYLDQQSTGALEAALETDCRVTLPGVYFAFDSDKVSPASAPALQAVVTVLTPHPDWRLVIEGHTDSVGGAAYNLDLSQRRAAAVRLALVEGYGIDGARLATAGFGLTQPVASNETAEGRARNRRVELARPCDG